MREGPIDFGELSNEIKSIEEEVESRFTKTIKAIQDQDETLADELLKSYKKMITKVSDDIVKNVASGKIQFNDSSQGASIVLYARYLKRIGAHLKNITSTIVNPYDRIGYNQ
jgi:phosphate uptake regulator